MADDSLLSAQQRAWAVQAQTGPLINAEGVRARQRKRGVEISLHATDIRISLSKSESRFRPSCVWAIPGNGC